ncbi:MAG: DUF2202 domain-containing protein [Candidatus Pacebacteria bacterium]|nr:DUF2202 domain-containing protein [Candidatus Paceibacterota bacterium]
MKTIIISIAFVLVSLVIISTFAVSGDPVKNEVRSKVSAEDMTTPIKEDFLSVRPELAALPMSDISADEKTGLLYMREEEKLARDVYTTLYQKWGVQVFANIAQSENTHTEAMRALLEKYSITDLVTDDTVGVFVNADLKKLYIDLTAKGLVSIEEALTVGALIEDLDISDLERLVVVTDNEDIKLVYGNLTRGSRNHIRSFTSQLAARGMTYTATYISADSLAQILATPREQGTGVGHGAGNGGGRW